MIPSNPILFLDLDGVCNCRSFRKAHWPKNEDAFSTWWIMLCSTMVKRINKITDETKADIVVISDWRTKMDTDILMEVLRKGGIKAPIVGGTPVVRQQRRDVEIACWIGQNIGWDDMDAVATIRMVAIDDNPQLFPTIRGKVIQTSDETGITDNHVRLGIRMIQEPMGMKTAICLRDSGNFTDAWGRG